MNKFCEKCGTALIDGVCPKCVQNETTLENRYEKKFKNFFMSPNEKLIAVLGNSYIEKFFQNGSLNNGFAVVSDKRAYFQGNNYSISYNAKGKMKIVKNHQSRTVDLKDITGTGTDTYANIMWKVWGYIGLVFVGLVLVSIFGTISVMLG